MNEYYPSHRFNLPWESIEAKNKRTNMITKEEAEKRVTRGRKLLKKFFGKDVLYKIDINRLEIRSNCDCVLGQLFNDDYQTARIIINRQFPKMKNNWVFSHGFFLEDHEGGFNKLQKAWIKRIEKAKLAREKKNANKN